MHERRIYALLNGKSPIDLTERIERNHKAAGGGAS
jgi:hypothetical protein